MSANGDDGTSPNIHVNVDTNHPLPQESHTLLPPVQSATQQPTSNDYGSTTPQPPVPTLPSLSVNRHDIQQQQQQQQNENESDVPSSDDVPSPNRRMRLRALRAQTQIITILSFFRRKYLEKFLISVYFTILIGTAPFTVWLFLEFRYFAYFYLLNSRLIHISIQLINIILLYLFISSGFNLQALFTSAGLNSLLGNVFIALCSGALLAVECLDRIAIYMHEASYNQNGIFVPDPSSIFSPSTNYSNNNNPTTNDSQDNNNKSNPDQHESDNPFSPNSPFLIISLGIMFFSFMTAIINFMHLMYYIFEYRRAVNRAVQNYREGDNILDEDLLRV